MAGGEGGIVTSLTGTRGRAIAAAILLLIIGGCARPQATTTAPPVASSPTTASLASPSALAAATGTATTAPSLEPEQTPSPTSTGRQVEFDERLAEIEYRLPLTIQHISRSSAWVFFELESPAEGEIFYWVDGMRELGVSSVRFEAGTGRHVVELSDLMAGRRYKVRVGIPSTGDTYRSPGLNGEAWGELTVKMLPQEVEHLRVAVIGDSGFGEQITYALAAQIAALEPDFMIHTGDIVYSAFENGTPLRAYQAKYFWPFQKVLLTAPVYAVPGNHEYYGDASIGSLPYYFEVFPPVENFIGDGTWIGSGQQFRNWYAVRLMGYQFLFLESQRFYRPEGVSAQTEWLGEMLTEHDGPSIVTFHIAAYTSGRHGRDGLPIQRTWGPLFDPSSVALILSGHDHNYERLSVNGIDYIVSGGGSRKLYSLEEPVEGSQVFAAQSHFVMLDIFPDRIEVESVNAFGDVLDRATLSISP